MAHTSLDRLMRHVRSLAAGQGGKDRIDGELLRAFCARNDQDAFAVLTKRYGPLVLSVCRRVLGQLQDAEDAFQATFILLARHAASLVKKDSLAGWLHGVAYRIALNARRAGVRRRRHERQSKMTSPTNPAWEAAWREVQLLLDEEVQRLPNKYREPFVLCSLGGQSCSAAARQLGLKEGTVWSRLAEARKRLQARLSRRGVALSAVLGTVALAPNSAMASVPAALVAKAVEASAAAAASSSLPAGVVSEHVAVLVTGMTRSLLLKKAKLGVALFLAVGALVGVAGIGAYQWSSAERAASQDKNSGVAPVAKDRLVGPEKKSIATDQFGDRLPDGAVARLGAQRFRHEGEAAGLLFTPDGKTLVGQTNSGVILWDAATGRELRRMPVPFAYGAVNAIGVSPDGKTLAISEIVRDDQTNTGDNQKIGLWELHSGKKMRTLLFPLGETGSGLHIPTKNHLCFTPDGKSLICLAGTGKNGRKAVVLDLVSDKVRLSLGDENSGFYDYAVSPDGKMLATVVYPNSGIKLWDIATGKLIRKLPADYVRAMAFSPDGKMLAFRSNRISLVDIATGKISGRLESEAGVVGWNDGLTFTPDGKKLAYGSFGGVVLMDVATGKNLHTWSHFPWVRAFGGSMALTPDGRTIAYGANQTTLKLWDADTGKELFREYQGHEAQISSLAFSPNGKTLVSTDDDLQIFVWDLASKQRTAILPRSARALSFSPDGTQLAMTAVNKDESATRVGFWDVGAGKETLVIAVPNTRTVRAATFSPDGRKLFTIDWNKDRRDPYRLRHWNAVTGKQDQEWIIPHQDDPAGTYRPGTRPGTIPHPAITLSLTPDGRKVFAAQENKVISVYDVGSGRKRLLPVQKGEEVLSLAPSPDARVLAVAWVKRARFAYATLESNTSIRLVEAVTGKEIFILKGHQGSVSNMAWSPDGKLLATGDRRYNPEELTEVQSVRLWDSATGKELARYGGLKADVTALIFAPDGKSLGAGFRNGSILIWDVSNADAKLAPAPKRAKDELESQWTDLAGDNAGKAHRAIWTLVARPKESVPFFQGRLKPIAVADGGKIEQWIADLNSEKFAVRHAATKELEKADVQALGPIQKALKGNLSLETSRRLEQILNTVTDVPGSEIVRTIRAIMALERIASPEAQGVLEALARGAPGARETEEARASLQWLEHRVARTP